jgi:hypothetical protein
MALKRASSADKADSERSTFSSIRSFGLNQNIWWPQDQKFALQIFGAVAQLGEHLLCPEKICSFKNL